jgi:two-component system copper resistance phosphate regulon response regulator CusR
MKVLIVEDEPKTGDYLKQGLSEAGFVADLLRDAVDGRHLALTDDYDLVVLDVMLPGLDGWQVLRELRQAGRHMPGLFLTARDQVEARVKGLNWERTISSRRWPCRLLARCAPSAPGQIRKTLRLPTWI